MKKLILSIFCLSGAFSGMHAQESFLNIVPSANALAESFPDSYLIRPKSATATSTQSGENIARAYDGNKSTIYHSSWSNTPFPVTLNFTFSDTVSQIDYLIYYPRIDGNVNGNFKAFEVWYSQRNDPAFVKYGDYDFAGTSLPTLIQFDSPLVAVDAIRLVVQSGENNFVSCAEIEFYREGAASDLSFLTAIFTDPACSNLKEGVTAEAIKAVPNPFYRKLAMDMLNGNYEREFRIQEYQSCQDPLIMARINKAEAYGMRDNPTGIYAEAGSDLIVLMGETDANVAPRLFIQQPEKTIEGSAYILRTGANKIRPTHGGLIYILYYSATGTEAPVKIHIAGGKVNGYYDKVKHKAPGEWERLLAQATFPLFDVKGEYVTMTFQTQAWRDYTKNNGPGLIASYDTLVYREQVFQGLLKYNKMNRCRMYMVVDFEHGSMYAISYKTGYSLGSQAGILDLAKIKSKTNTLGSESWGPAHEAGHVNQTRPGLRWQGMTEVTNNILSQYITTEFGVQSRLQAENVRNGKNRYTIATEEIVNAKIPHNQHTDVFCKLVPFWQLKLYLIDVLGQEDFYKDLYEKVRVNPDPVAANGSTSDGMCQLEFVRLACEVSGLDLTEFFTDWGFLTPYDVTIDDYGVKRFTVSQTAIDSVKAQIAAMNLPAPPLPEGKKLYEINDQNAKEWKN
jgi:hypothetical protein